MKIVEQSATLETVTPNAEKLIERAGRTCYKSEDKITDESAATFIAMILKRGHESVLEHASASFRIVCDRGVSHEIVRHRIASYSQESSRFCDYSKDKHGSGIAVIEPPGLDNAMFTSWKSACRKSESVYLELLKNGSTPQIARSVLPTCLKTEIVMTANFREWRHFIQLRTSPAAHPQIREIAEMIRVELNRLAPTCFAIGDVIRARKD